MKQKTILKEACIMRTKSTLILTMVILISFFGTVSLLSAGEAYDLNGDWDAVVDTGGWGTFEDSIRITQKENHFIGIYLFKGDNRVGKNEEKIKGIINSNGFEEVFLRVVDHVAFELVWENVEATISEDGNNIVLPESCTII